MRSEFSRWCFGSSLRAYYVEVSLSSYCGFWFCQTGKVQKVKCMNIHLEGEWQSNSRYGIFFKKSVSHRDSDESRSKFLAWAITRSRLPFWTLSTGSHLTLPGTAVAGGRKRPLYYSILWKDDKIEHFHDKLFLK